MITEFYATIVCIQFFHEIFQNFEQFFRDCFTTEN